MRGKDIRTHFRKPKRKGPERHVEFLREGMFLNAQELWREVERGGESRE